MEMRYGEAVNHGLGQAMAADETVLTWGEDVCLIHHELLARFGPDRVRDTPISEAAFVYAGVGAAMAGLRPVVEVMMVDFLPVAWSAVVNAAAMFGAFSNGRWLAPLVIRTRVGGWYTDGGQHEQTLWGQLAAYPGLKVVCPSNPLDAAGLMVSAIEDDGPVVYLEHKLLSETFLEFLGGSTRPTVDFSGIVPRGGAVGEVPETVVPVPIGEAARRRDGGEIALISVGVGVHRCLEAAHVLESDGVDASVLDLRSITPLDRAAIREAASKCGRVIVVDEDYIRGGLSGEVAAILLEDDIPCTFSRVAVEGTIPFAPHLEHAALPNVDRIVNACRGAMADIGPS